MEEKGLETSTATLPGHGERQMFSSTFWFVMYMLALILIGVTAAQTNNVLPSIALGIVALFSATMAEATRKTTTKS